VIDLFVVLLYAFVCLFACCELIKAAAAATATPPHTVVKPTKKKHSPKQNARLETTKRRMDAARRTKQRTKEGGREVPKGRTRMISNTTKHSTPAAAAANCSTRQQHTSTQHKQERR
jgi:hypothetical protein